MSEAWFDEVDESTITFKTIQLPRYEELDIPLSRSTAFFGSEELDLGCDAFGRHIGRHMEEISCWMVRRPHSTWEFYSESSSDPTRSTRSLFGPNRNLFRSTQESSNKNHDEWHPDVNFIHDLYEWTRRRVSRSASNSINSPVSPCGPFLGKHLAYMSPFIRDAKISKPFRR